MMTVVVILTDDDDYGGGDGNGGDSDHHGYAATDGHGAVDGPELDLREPALLEDVGWAAAARRQRRAGGREVFWLHAQKDQ